MLNVRQDERRMARFAQYAMVASEEALADAGWTPQKDDDLEATVRCVIYI
jgi:3-oxoacyl-[acyl-carrier-protein] synthase II